MGPCVGAALLRRSYGLSFRPGPKSKTMLLSMTMLPYERRPLLLLYIHIHIHIYIYIHVYFVLTHSFEADGEEVEIVHGGLDRKQKAEALRRLHGPRLANGC